MRTLNCTLQIIFQMRTLQNKISVTCCKLFGAILGLFLLPLAILHRTIDWISVSRIFSFFLFLFLLQTKYTLIEDISFHFR